MFRVTHTVLRHVGRLVRYGALSASQAKSNDVDRLGKSFARGKRDTNELPGNRTSFPRAAIYIVISIFIADPAFPPELPASRGRSAPLWILAIHS